MTTRALAGLAAGASLALAIGLAPPARAGVSPHDDIRDIHGPVIRTATRPRWWAIAAGATVVAAAAGAGLWPGRRERRLPPDARALRALAQQRAESTRHPRDFAIAVSQTVRAYLEESFAIHAPRRTTDELLADLIQQAGPLAPHKFELTEFLRQCDLAKFAGAALSPARMNAMLDSAEALIKATAAPAQPAAPTAPLAGVA